MHLVFSDVKFVIMAVCIFSIMTFSLLIMSEYVFLEPFVVGHVPQGTELGFVLVIAISVLSGVIIPANIYRVFVLHRSKQKMSGGLAGSIIGSIAGACSCGPIGFAVISTFGTVGATATAFLTSYEIPLRFIAIAILLITLASTYKSINVECKIQQ